MNLQQAGNRDRRWLALIVLWRNSQDLWIRRATLFFPPAVWLTTLIFATVLAVVKSWARIRGGRTPGVQRR